MAFWRDIFDRMSNVQGITPNANGPADYHPGDPDGIEEIVGPPVEARSLPIPWVSPWDGWPAEWNTPNWEYQAGINKLIDIAFACIDLNANVISSMPVYQLRNGRILDPETWMLNPDPDIYSSWHEFLKQLMWDYQLGEAFVMPFEVGFNGYPTRFRVMPPWTVEVEMVGSRRRYKIGALDVTDQILHIRYKSETTLPRGIGPLEAAGARQTAIGLLQRYANTIAENGGRPLYWMEVERRINESEGRDLMDRWIESRAKNVGQPALVANGAKLHEGSAMSARDMTLMELSQFNESRIAVLLGVMPFLVGLAGASGSLTYSNVSDLTDFHYRAGLRSKVVMVMEALSAWALPAGRSAELNRDDYTRLPFDKRMMAYDLAIKNNILTPEEIRIMERFYGETQITSPQALTGGSD